MSHHAELRRVIEEGEIATGLAAQRFLPRFSRKLARYRELLESTRNPLARRYYAWQANRYGRLAADAEHDIARARDIRSSRHGGLLPRR
jgi:hypothetical protein